MDSFEKNINESYKKRFGCEPEIMLFAPGRVNLIGEHIDYNGGRVMPCSLSVGTYGAADSRKDEKICVFSADFPRSYTEIKLSELKEMKDEPSAFEKYGWAAYPFGVAKKLLGRGFDIKGFSMGVTGSLPRGSGLSSSASLEVLTCAVLKRLFGLELDGVTASIVSLEAERDCAGVNCGIMDQFICAMGRKERAVLLDTATLKYDYKPFNMGENVLLIMNTRKPRRLADSKYNERRFECERAFEIIGKCFDEEKKCLCDITPEEFESVKERLPEPIRRRARHAVYENARTFMAAAALEDGDMVQFGKLLTASHESLKNDYEVTGKELDSIVKAALSMNGVLGARMTGAGFGGCAIALAKKKEADRIIEEVSRIYNMETGYECEIFKAETFNAPFAV